MPALSSPLSLRAIPSLSAEDSLFLQRVFAQRPDIAAGFERFAQAPAHNRIPMAARILERLPRTGWGRLNITPDSTRSVLTTHASALSAPIRQVLCLESLPKQRETILEHAAEASEFYAIVFQNSANLQLGVEVM